MSSKLFICSLLAAVAVSSACTSAEPNANAAQNSNTNVMVNIDPKDLPPGLTASPLPPSTNTTPGIPPANQVNLPPKGGTPTPGIPDPKTLNKPMKPGATPTPGIPDADTLRRQMQRPATDVNKPAPANGEMMMRSTKRPVNSATPQ